MSANGASIWSGCGATGSSGGQSEACPPHHAGTRFALCPLYLPPLRLQILLQDRHLDREAAIVGEHHADEFVARVQVG